jgi:hypothetical protein
VTVAQLRLIEPDPKPRPIARRFHEAARRGLPAARAALRNNDPTTHADEETS